MKILVRLPNWLGDLVMSAGFVKHLETVYPGASIDVIIKRGIDPLVHYFKGIRQVHVFDKQDFQGLSGAMRFGSSLAHIGYDLAFCLPDSFSSAAMLWKTKARKVVGYRKELRSFLLSKSYKKPSGLHRVEEYIRLLELYSGQVCEAPEVKLINHAETFYNQIIINVNSEADSRRLPVHKATAIIDLLATRTNCPLILVGSPKEVPHVTAVYNGLKHRQQVHNLAGTTDMDALIALFGGSRVMLTTDSGPMHLANALGVYTVALEGASDERNTAPYNADTRALLRYGKLPCEPCVKNTCQFGVPKCLENIDNELIVQSVLKAAEQMNVKVI